MLSFKFSTLFIALSLMLNIQAFDDNSCLNANFDTKVVHKGQPFGMTMNILEMKKTGCILEVKHEKLKFVKKTWMVDVCREPVHIKKGSGAVEVIKKTSPCNKKSKDAFCAQNTEVKTIIQDDGLIFAEGEKENLSSDHGKIYCGYLLLKAYMDRDIIFSKAKNYNGVLEGATPMNNAPAISTPPASIPRPTMDNQEPAKEEESEEKVEAEPTPPSEKSSGTGSF